ncbi:MAG: GNAT family N-acetyltransferase [Patescibacteria group bacterium]
MIVLECASPDKRQLLENLLQLYAYDFSEFAGDEISESGDYGFSRLLRYYWKDQDSEPFIVRVNGNIAGFVMVRRKRFNGVDYQSIAEFFVLKKYRKRGVGREVAQMVFKKFPGKWYVDVIQSNLPACAFWEKVIDDFTGEKYVKSGNSKDKTIFTFA